MHGVIPVPTPVTPVLDTHSPVHGVIPVPVPARALRPPRDHFRENERGATRHVSWAEPLATTPQPSVGTDLINPMPDVPQVDIPAHPPVLEAVATTPGFTLSALAALQPRATPGSDFLFLDGSIFGARVRVLLDSAAGRNFISSFLLERLGRKPSVKTTPDNVLLPDGEHMTSGSVLPSVRVKLSGFTDVVTFHVLPLNTFDVILGKPWLTEHNPAQLGQASCYCGQARSQTHTPVTSGFVLQISPTTPVSYAV